MPWTCRLVSAPGPGPDQTPFADLRPGDMWFAPYLLDREHEEYPGPEKLSPRYWALPEPRRLPIVVRLPGPCDFAIDTLAWRHDGERFQHLGDGWTVTGEAPLLTMSPSINIGGAYHGYIQNGVVTEDCEGRLFDANGRRTT